MAKKGIHNFIPSLIWALIILYLSSMNPSSLDQFDWSDIANIDKLGHFGFYSILSFLLALGYYLNGLKKIDNRKILIVIVIAITYGAIIEYLQYSLIKGRYFDILDLLANIIGCFSGIVIFIVLKRNRVWIFH